MSFLFGKNQIRRAIERGLSNGNLDDELRDDSLTPLKRRADGDAVVWGLEQILSQKADQLSKRAYALARLFQEVEDGDCDAFAVLRQRGIPELIRIFDEISPRSTEEDVSAIMFILKILALYGTTEGTLKVIQAARQQIGNESYMWSVVLGNYKAGHPEAELLFRSLADPLPDKFIAVSLLDAANANLIKDGTITHPFDSPDGRQRLRDLLASRDPDEFSYAHSATAALPFINDPERDELLNLATKHPNAEVQIEAAWAAAKIGREDGLQRLASFCCNVNHAQTAMRYLCELEREDVIPSKARQPDFQALAEFSQWLAHPNELGRAPDSVEIVDHRTLRWPPEREPKPFWLVRYTAKDCTGLDDDDIGCGLVGSATFCFFSYELEQRPPEDGYAIHCYWEMQQHGLIEESNVAESADEYHDLLKQWNREPLEKARVIAVAEIAPELGYSKRIVGLASAGYQGVDGWLVLDGNETEWYPKSEMLEEDGTVALKIHVGRRLLGFTGPVDRNKYRRPPISAIPPEQIIAAYEKLLREAAGKQGTKREMVYSFFGPIGKHLSKFASALKATGRCAEITPVIESLVPLWDHCSGYTGLGAAAFECGDFETAEGVLSKAREKCGNWERSKEMGYLAEIWCRKGRFEDAKQLLIACLQRLLAESKTATGTDIQLFEEWYQTQRKVFLTLFVSEGEAALSATGLPVSTLN